MHDTSVELITPGPAPTRSSDIFKVEPPLLAMERLVETLSLIATSDGLKCNSSVSQSIMFLTDKMRDECKEIREVLYGDSVLTS